MKVWKVSPGRDARAWESHRDKDGIIWIGFKDGRYMACSESTGVAGDLKNYSDNEKDFKEEVIKRGISYIWAKELWRFYGEMQIGDIVLANKGMKKLLGIGKIMGGYECITDSEGLTINSWIYGGGEVHKRNVKWMTVFDPPLDLGDFSFNTQFTIKKISRDEWVEIKDRVIKYYPDLKGKIEGIGTKKLISDPEIESIAMKFAIYYEKGNGRKPRRSSNRGYDIYSKDEEERFIKVKGMKEEGKIIFTDNEWETAKKLGDKYWIYVITNIKDSPKIHQIQNPASKLKPEEQIEIKYIIGNWKEVTAES